MKSLKLDTIHKISSSVWAGYSVKDWNNVFRLIRRPISDNIIDSIYLMANFNFESKI